MTLILIMANQQQAVLVSDRRLSYAGKLVDDECNKAFVFICRNARLAIAYTGLAKTGKFLTKEWLPTALMDAAAPDFLMEPTMERFRQTASRDFAGLQVNRPSDKRISVVFAGYSYDVGTPRAYFWLVSNFENLQSQQNLSTPVTEFTAEFFREICPTVNEPSILIVGGVDRAPYKKDLVSLQDILRENSPSRALVDKGVEVIQAAADSPLSGGTIGKQCTSIIIPSDPRQNVIGEYHSAKVAHTLFPPSFINARGGDSGVFVISDPEFKFLDSQGHPIVTSVPKVGRNMSCPCGSGLKYKQCHGRFRQA